MIFHNAYSMPQCTPSRATLLTGTYPWRNGFVNHWDVPRWGVGYFDWKQKENTTFARLLKDLGYKTAISGKWQINDFRIEPEALKKHGFDDWAMWTGFETGNPPSRERYSDPYVHTSEGSKTYPGKFGPDIYTDFLIGFMKKHKDQPLCLYYAMCLPHTPYVATPDEPNAETKMEKQKAMVRYADKCVGRLVSALGRTGSPRQYHRYIYHRQRIHRKRHRHSQWNSCLWRQSKENRSRSQCTFHRQWTRHGPAGVESDALTDFSDLLPTFVELADGTVPEDLTIDGISIAPVLLGKAQESGREWIMALGHGHAALDEHGVRGVRDFAGRVIRDHQFKVWVNEERQIDRLHDLKVDPLEKNNLVESTDPVHQAAIQKFQKVVDSLPKKDGRPLYEPRAPNPWDRKKK
jgi:arylsulfatase A-like enzyme